MTPRGSRRSRSWPVPSSWRRRRASHLRIDPEIELGADPRRGRAAGRRLDARPRASPPAASPILTSRPARTRSGRACARSGASTSTRPGGGVPVDDAGEPDSTTSTGSTGDGDAAPGSSSARRWPIATSGRRTPRATGAAAVRRARRRRAGRDAVPRGRRPGRRAVRRDDPGGRRLPRQLLAQVGGDPQLEGAGRHELRPVGPRPSPESSTSRPGSAAARSPTSARTTSCSTRSCTPSRASFGAPRSWWRAGGTACPCVAATRARLARDRTPPRGRGPVAVRVTALEAPAGWDESVIDAPGGNVLPGTAWAAHRRAEGWTPWFLTFEDDRRALVLTHPQPPLPGVVAYAPRGPCRGRRRG